jgi:hypothetical protein
MHVVSLFRDDGTANPAYLKLDLYCKGLRIDASCDLGEDARDIIRNRAGLGSGLEVIIGDDMFTNVPVVEWWVSVSPYVLVKKRRESTRSGRKVAQAPCLRACRRHACKN